MGEYNRRSVLRLAGTALGGVAAGTTVTAAERTDRFIVNAKGRTSAEDLEAEGLSVVHDLAEVGYFVVEGAERDVEAAPGEFAPDLAMTFDGPVAEADVESASGTESATDEPFYGYQWDKQAQGIPDVHATTRGEGSRVAVIDTGVAAEHPDLAHAVNEDLSRNFSGDGQGAANAAGGYHGTHVAGIVAASDENQSGIVGSAPATEVVDCRVFANDGSSSFGAIVAAILHSARVDADVANLSLGNYPVPRSAYARYYARFLHRTTTYAARTGTLVVAATGNDGVDLDTDGAVVAVPAEAPGVLAVSATGPIGFRYGDPGLEEPTNSPASYTNHGESVVDVSAPGGDVNPEQPPGWEQDLVLSSVSIPQYDADGNYLGATHTHFWMSGTSMAAPQVAGAAALVASRSSRLRGRFLDIVLRRTATDAPGGREYHGHGHLDTLAAVRAADRTGGHDDASRGRGQGRDDDDDDDHRRGQGRDDDHDDDHRRGQGRDDDDDDDHRRGQGRDDDHDDDHRRGRGRGR
jgi:subtilisin family serine protease